MMESIKWLDLGSIQQIYKMDTDSIKNEMCECVTNANTPAMVYIDSNEVISHIIMNESNQKFFFSKSRFLVKYFENGIKFPVVIDKDDEELLKLKVYFTYQMIFLGINNDLAHMELQKNKIWNKEKQNARVT